MRQNSNNGNDKDKDDTHVLLSVCSPYIIVSNKVSQ